MIESFLVLSEIVFEQLVEEVVVDFQRIKLKKLKFELSIS
jgi:hypothetical protein